jgi:hypothetical protein
MNTVLILKWSAWVLLAAALVVAVYLPSLLILAYRYNANLEYVAHAMLVGILVNLVFRDTKLLYALAVSLPLLSAIIIPKLIPTVVAACVALVWGLLSFLLGAMRARI